jgi:hypothetical protein
MDRRFTRDESEQMEAKDKQQRRMDIHHIGSKDSQRSAEP